MRGLGPEWKDITVTVGLDDIESSTPDYEIIDMIRREVKYQLEAAGYIHYTIEDINTI